MASSFKRASVVAAAVLAFVFAARGIAEAIPVPIVHYVGQQNYMAGGQQFTRYNLAVVNYSVYPPALFAPAPNLPPCGLNKNSARTWVDIFQRGGQRLYGFCALRSPHDLLQLWFAKPAGQPHPHYVYVVLTDRLTNTKAQSKLVVVP
ncbi:MAG TPA: hypothetical protein VK665_12860 [Candidatus Elarobacter sp.]|nr:hypothetical protein [Candidatus Elarobacter sp.]